ncbi:MAG: electron transport complex subunit RsxB [Burkholderiales bacterium]
MSPPPIHRVDWVSVIHAALPQTQCTRCGFPDCHSYAQAILEGQAEINQCPPGGQEGVRRLAQLTGRPTLPLDTAHGQESERSVAIIDENGCIGCTLCIQACPVDSIIGAPKAMHTVIESSCTGCELCLPACPVDCISLESVTPGRTGWQAWDETLATQARDRYEFRLQRQQIDDPAAQLKPLAEHARLEAETLEKKRQIIEAAIMRSEQSRSQPVGPGASQAETAPVADNSQV